MSHGTPEHLVKAINPFPRNKNVNILYTTLGMSSKVLKSPIDLEPKYPDSGH